ncbi:MAG: ABC transporter substrate-binding protein [Sporomusaceae bacterium]|nr:ABC transporter substrate-binding protein [Sporomusaceae bacterium]
MKKYMFLLALLCGVAALFFAGCGAQKSADQGKDGNYLTIQDNAGRTVTLTKKPEKVVVLSTSFLDLLYSVDGKAAGRPSSKTESVPEAAASVPEVGFVYNVNLEKVMALQPDLVIAVQGMHEKLLPTLESNHIPVLLLKYKTLEDTLTTITLLGKIVGTESKASQLVQSIQDKISAIKAKVPQGPPLKVAILHATSKSVTVELDNTIAGSIAKRLGLVNVASGTTAPDKDSDNVPYSLEKLVDSNPDMVFVVTMGNAAEIGARMKSDVESNPAWSTLSAVKNQKVYFLPSDLFLLNPGLKIPDAVEYMAKIVYPEVYGRVQ